MASGTRTAVVLSEKSLQTARSPLGRGSTAEIGSKVGSEAPGALVSWNPDVPPIFLIFALNPSVDDA